jgi:hypothetical protein
MCRFFASAKEALMTRFRVCWLLLLLPAPLAFPQPVQAGSQNQPATATAPPQQSQPSSPQREDKPDINRNIESNLRDAFGGDPALSGAQIDVKVDDVAITLTGSVQSEGQHRRAVQLASQYGQYRQIVDKLVTK